MADQIVELELTDTRLTFIAEFMLESLKCKPDKFTKLLLVEESNKAIVEFVGKPDVEYLLISQGSGGFLSASNKFPDNPKAKGIFFIKHNLTEAINADCSNFRSNVYMGELNPAAIENFSALVEEVQTESGIYISFTSIVFMHVILGYIPNS